VRLMTIHGAKGLEAHTVLLLDTNIAADKAKSLDVLVDWPGEKSAPQTFAFLRSESSAPHCVQNALQHERKQRAREEINALYVAMTRAKTQLAISGHEVRSPDSRCPWMRLEAAQAVHPGLMEEAWHGDFAAPLEQKEHEADAHFGIMELPRVELSKMTSSLPILEKNRPLGGIKSAQGATKSIVNQSELDTTASRIGSCMHRLLELYRPGLALESIAPAVAQSFGLDEAQMGQAVQLARNITQGPAAWLWDTAQIDWQANEVELRYEGQLLRIDRLVRQRRDGQWWVLDYKSAYQPQAQEDLLMQLKRYANAVQAAQVAQASAKDSGASLVKAAFITGSGQLVEVP
jgi:ATP-dependent helicase/nuclease subunit A